jgi:hypothetical protein
VAPDGAFLAWLPLPDDSVAIVHLEARKDGEVAVSDLRVRMPPRFVPPAQGLWLDALSLEPRGAIWAQSGEQIRVAARAASGAAAQVVLPDGRVFPLAPDSSALAAYGAFGLALAGAVLGLRPWAKLGGGVPDETAKVMAPDGFFKGPSCMTTPVRPVDTIRIASSSELSGIGEFVL